eukprot:5671073-Pleurochrysis_carterae.AAC.1
MRCAADYRVVGDDHADEDRDGVNGEEEHERAVRNDNLGAHAGGVSGGGGVCGLAGGGGRAGGIDGGFGGVGGIGGVGGAGGVGDVNGG